MPADAQTTDPDLAHFLAERDYPCPGCGYNLRGLSTPSCPECAQPLELSVHLAEPRLGPLIAAAAGLLTGAGSAGFLVLFVFFMVIAEGGGMPSEMFFLLILYPLVIVALEVTCAVRLLSAGGRRRFRSLDDDGRTGIVWGCWIFTVVAGVIWFALLRVNM